MFRFLFSVMLLEIMLLESHWEEMWVKLLLATTLMITLSGEQPHDISKSLWQPSVKLSHWCRLPVRVSEFWMGIILSSNHHTGFYLSSQEFRLKHYAGNVTYNVTGKVLPQSIHTVRDCISHHLIIVFYFLGFVDKNNDLLFRDLKEVIFTLPY